MVGPVGVEGDGDVVAFKVGVVVDVARDAVSSLGWYGVLGDGGWLRYVCGGVAGRAGGSREVAPAGNEMEVRGDGFVETGGPFESFDRGGGGPLSGEEAVYSGRFCGGWFCFC